MDTPSTPGWVTVTGRVPNVAGSLPSPLVNESPAKRTRSEDIVGAPADRVAGSLTCAAAAAAAGDCSARRRGWVTDADAVSASSDPCWRAAVGEPVVACSNGIASNGSSVGIVVGSGMADESTAEPDDRLNPRPALAVPTPLLGAGRLTGAAMLRYPTRLACPTAVRVG